MITLMLLPNFKGTKSEWMYATITSLLLDSMYIIPMMNHFI